MNDLTADPAASTLISKVWNLAHVLNGAGVGSGEYTEQVTYLLFLKLDDERVEEEGLPSLLPEACRWQQLAPLGGAELARTYASILDQLGRAPGLIGAIYARARPTVEEPAHLKRLVGLIGAETWSAFGADVKGAIYEGLLERTASDIKSGTGQYFTPRPLIQAIVEVVDPTPRQTVCDPACGTGGFLLAAYDHMRRNPRSRRPRHCRPHARPRLRRERHRRRRRAPGHHEPVPARPGQRRAKPGHPGGRSAWRSRRTLGFGADQPALRPQTERPGLHR